MPSIRPLRLRSHDVVVALQLVLTPDATYPALSSAVGLSLGESHNAVKRLEAARLARQDSRAVEKRALVDFLVHGVPYAFPGVLGAATSGVPTAFGSPALQGPTFHGSRSRPPVVWPDHPDTGRSTGRGAGLAPLCGGAASFVEANPGLYGLLTLVDALRIGRAGAHHALERALRQQIHEG